MRRTTPVAVTGHGLASAPVTRAAAVDHRLHRRRNSPSIKGSSRPALLNNVDADRRLRLWSLVRGRHPGYLLESMGAELERLSVSGQGLRPAQPAGSIR